MTKARTASVFQVLVRVGGPVKGYKAALYVMRWLIACELSKRGDDFTAIQKYEDYWLTSTATHMRERRALRASLLPGVDMDDFLARVHEVAVARRSVKLMPDEGDVLADLASVSFVSVVPRP